jgi:hypothetical protein
MIKTQHSTSGRLLFGLLLFFVSTIVFAAPNGKELLLACKHFLAKGFSGAEGMMCTWYVTPCDCFHGDNTEIPRVCLSSSPNIDDLAREVTEGLAMHPELFDKNTAVAAAMILEKSFHVLANNKNEAFQHTSPFGTDCLQSICPGS